MNTKTELAAHILGGLLANPNNSAVFDDDVVILVKRALKIADVLLEVEKEQRKSIPLPPPTPAPPSFGKTDNEKEDWFTRRDY